MGMLTDERLKELDGLASEIIVSKLELRNAVNEIAHAYYTLQQQNEQLIEGIDRISDGLTHYNPVYRSLQNLLKSIQGGGTDNE